jgi:hypothetical protein
MRLVSWLARALEPIEREAVLGDLEESGAGAGAALRDLLGLILRRQAALWTRCRTWIALLGVAGLAGVPLSRIVFGINGHLGLQLSTYRKYGVRYETGVAAWQDLAWLLCLVVALAAWSWTSGFALGALSGRAVWLTWAAFYLVVLRSAWTIFMLSGRIGLRDPPSLWIWFASALPLSFATLLFSAAAFWGAWMGVCRRALSPRAAYSLVFGVAILMIAATWMSGWYETAHEVWSGGVWPRMSWPRRVLPFLLVSSPAAYLVFLKDRRQKEGESE